MKEFHPDKHAASLEEEKSRMATKATEVTRAYSILEKPLSRAIHLLGLQGAPIEEADSVSGHVSE